MTDPVYPVYVDTNVMHGNTGPADEKGEFSGLIYMRATAENQFTPEIPEQKVWKNDVGSIIVVAATDAPLIPTQLKRLAKRVSLGLGRNGSYSGDGSGDIFIAFSTANPGAAGTKGLQHLTMLPNDQIDPIFLATVQATEEAVINAMVAAETMTGINNRTVIALPHDRLREILKKYNRLEK